LTAWGFSAFHATRLWRYVYRDLSTDFDGMDELPAKLRQHLAEHATLPQLHVDRQVHSSDGLTHKFALRLADGQVIETVEMECDGRTTACLSSQAGCAVGCVFCATGQIGFRRHLTTGEIVSQAVIVARQSSLRNIVLMGMGEPLLNYEAVLRAAEILCDSAGLAIGTKQITLSTVGVAPAIVRLADEGRKLSLAVSLHGATDAERIALVPAARAWPLAELIGACRYYASKLRRRIFFEWTLIAGVNDSDRQAIALAKLLRGIPAQVNLIPLNPTPGFNGAPSQPSNIETFRAALHVNGLRCSIRKYRGVDVGAGCGQLAGILG
jgi:23S rRNA (adenine2503-C2)-methyltransferase